MLCAFELLALLVKKKAGNVYRGDGMQTEVALLVCLNRGRLSPRAVANTRPSAAATNPPAHKTDTTSSRVQQAWRSALLRPAQLLPVGAPPAARYGDAAGGCASGWAEEAMASASAAMAAPTLPPRPAA